MLIDLHTHTYPNSDDSFLSPTELILRAKKSGLDGICLTEHDWYWSHEAAAQLARELDFVVIPGVETNTEDGHFIVFGLDRFKFHMGFELKPFREGIVFNPLLKPFLLFGGRKAIDWMARKRSESDLWRKASRALRLATGDLFHEES